MITVEDVKNLKSGTKVSISGKEYPHFLTSWVFHVKSKKKKTYTIILSHYPIGWSVVGELSYPNSPYAPKELKKEIKNNPELGKATSLYGYCLSADVLHFYDLHIEECRKYNIDRSFLR